MVRGLKFLGVVLLGVVFLAIGPKPTAFAGGNGNDHGNGNSKGTIQLSSIPNPGQQVFFGFSPAVDGDKYKLDFTDVTSKDQQGTPQPVWAYRSGDNGTYEFKMPTTFVQGDTYDITVTINGTTYEKSLTIPVAPGHQLPETRYAIVLPVILLGVLLLGRRKSRGVGAK